MNRTRGLFYEVAGRYYKDLAEAQRLELIAMVPGEYKTIPEAAGLLADWMMANGAAIVNILTSTPRSRNRKPRKDKGVPRKKQEVAP